MQSEWQAVEVALFPIPEVVAFPGMVVPLHVFEPRYRQLVKDCVVDNRLVAVSHTLKTIHEPSRFRTADEALNANQATYKAQKVFSAGHCEIVETTADGRLFATVTMSQRLVFADEVQSLPYRIVSCKPLEDDMGTESSDDANLQLQHAIHDRLTSMVSTDDAALAMALRDPLWIALTPAEYSFRIFRVLRFQADVMQSLLETKCVTERLEMIAAFLGTD